MIVEDDFGAALRSLDSGLIRCDDKLLVIILTVKWISFLYQQFNHRIQEHTILGKEMSKNHDFTSFETYVHNISDCFYGYLKSVHILI